MSTRRRLTSTIALAGFLIAPAVFSSLPAQSDRLIARAQVFSAVVSCLHGSDSAPHNQTRRAQAQAVARAINDGQTRAVGASGRYAELSALANLPPVPEGFSLRLYTDEDGYVASLKDTFDPCRYGLFTDQQNRLYESSPQVPLLAN